jgi:hypothetical protein
VAWHRQRGSSRAPKAHARCTTVQPHKFASPYNTPHHIHHYVHRPHSIVVHNLHTMSTIRRRLSHAPALPSSTQAQSHPYTFAPRLGYPPDDIAGARSTSSGSCRQLASKSVKACPDSLSNAVQSRMPAQEYAKLLLALRPHVVHCRSTRANHRVADATAADVACVTLPAAHTGYARCCCPQDADDQGSDLAVEGKGQARLLIPACRPDQPSWVAPAQLKATKHGNTCQCLVNPTTCGHVGTLIAQRSSAACLLATAAHHEEQQLA